MLMRFPVVAYLALLLNAFILRADQIEMKNGDRFTGHVVSMTTNSIVFDSETLGNVTLSREKVAHIRFGDNLRPPAAVAGGAAVSTNAVTNARFAAAMRHLGAESNVVEAIRAQFLAGAGPEANAKFEELAAGLLTGKFDLEKLRTEAKKAADQLRELKRSGDVGDTMDSYLSVLDKFLRESAPAPSASPSTNSEPLTPSASTTNSASSITIIRKQP